MYWRLALIGLKDMEVNLRTLGPNEAQVVLSLRLQNQSVVQAAEIIDLLGSDLLPVPRPLFPVIQILLLIALKTSDVRRPLVLPGELCQTDDALVTNVTIVVTQRDHQPLNRFRNTHLPESTNGAVSCA